MEEIVKHINDTNASYRNINAGDAKNTDLFLDNEHYSFFEGCGEEITVRFSKENLAKAIMFIASILPRKFDQSATHKKITYSKEFVLEQLSILDGLFMENASPTSTITQIWTARKNVLKKNGEIDTRFYFNGLLRDVEYTDLFGNIQHTKFTVRNYLAGGYSDLHIIKSDDGVFDIEITNTQTPYYDGKDDDVIEQIDVVRKNDTLQQILFGAPGTGKSHTINSDANITEQNSIRTTFHPDSDYSTFVGCYKPTKDEKSGEITYDFTPQAFTNAYVAAWKDLGKPFYLIIEEINRGNCAQIFGDIFQLLDRNEQGYSSYKTTPDQDLMNYIKTQFSETNIKDADVKSGNKMQLPPNLHIWATMNTSDQSLFPIDSAFKRRWDWRYIPIDYTDNYHYIDCGDTQYSWADFLQKVNDKVESVTQSEDKKLGYWFMGNGKEQTEITIDRFVSKVVFYLWNDVFKDFGKSGNTIFKDSFGKFHLFFDSSGKPKEDVVKAFLDALEVKSGVREAGDPDDKTLSNSIDYTKNSFNGENKLSQKALGEKIVLKYLKQNPNLSFEQIRNIFTFDNSVETPYQYKGIIAKTEDITNERAYSAEQTSSDGVKYKILTWWNKYNINFIIKFAEAQGWTITEEQK